MLEHIPRWLVVLTIILVLVFLVAEVLMYTAFSEDALRAGVKGEFNKTKNCLIDRLAPYDAPNQSDTYAKLISSYLIRGINKTEIAVRSVRREGWAYFANSTIRYGLPLDEQNIVIYASLVGERRIIGAAPDLGDKFGQECVKTCNENILVLDKDACRTACGKINNTISQGGCLGSFAN